MATSFYVACHTCKKTSNTDHNTQAFVEGIKDEWINGEHEGHSIEMICDVLMTDKDCDKYDLAMSYEKVPVQ